MTWRLHGLTSGDLVVAGIGLLTRQELTMGGRSPVEDGRSLSFSCTFPDPLSSAFPFHYIAPGSRGISPHLPGHGYVIAWSLEESLLETWSVWSG